MTHEFHPAARDEFVATIEYYEAALAGLGGQFRDAVKAALDQIDAYPQSGRSTSGGFRRAFVAGFPYDVVYQVHGQTMRILAVAHHRRRPGYWRRRTTG